MTIPAPIPFTKKNSIPLKILLYGKPYTGKTTFAGGAVEVGDVLFFNIEGGMLSLPANPAIKQFDIPNPAMDGTSYEQVSKVLWALAKRDFEQYPWLKGIRTIVMDSGSEFMNLTMEEIVRNAVAKDPRKRSDINDIHVEDYGVATTILTRMFRFMRDLPLNVIITALPKFIFPKVDPRKVNKEEIDPVDVRPYFTEKLGGSLEGFMDNVWYTYMKELDAPVNGRTRAMMMSTRPVGVYHGKTRGTKFPDALGVRVENPSFKAIFDLLQKTEKGE